MNLQLTPTPFLFLPNDEAMLIAIQSATVNNDGGNETEFARVTIPANTLSTVGDKLILDYLGTAAGTGNAITLVSKIVQGVDEGEIFNNGFAFGANQSWKIRVELTLVGTGVLKCNFFYIEEDSGGGQWHQKYSSQRIIASHDFDIVLTGLCEEPTDTFTRELAECHLIKAASGNPNFGTPTVTDNEVENHNPTVTGSLDFTFPAEYPNPDIWRLLLESAADGFQNTATDVAGDQRHIDIDEAAPADWTGRVRLQGLSSEEEILTVPVDFDSI